MAKKMIIAATMADPWLPSESAECPVHVYKTGEQLLQLPEEWYPVFKDLGVSILQFDSCYLNTNEPAEGKWDWSKTDRLIEKCLTNGFRPAYFPHWHWPPSWYEKSDDFTGCRCLQHNEYIPCFSIWSPKIKPWFQRCIKALREHYSSDEQLPAIYLGVHGDFGEAMYPMGMGIGEICLEHERGLKNAHWHFDYWCNDQLAQKDFCDFLSNKYSSISEFNSAWSSDYTSFSQVKFPAKPTGDLKRPWLDFIQWYYDSMTDFASFVAEIYRKYFPNARLMLPMGGGVEPLQYGQDNTALPKVMKTHHVTIRSTAAGSTQFQKNLSIPEKFQHNYPRLKRVVSACKFYDLEVWLEPPYPPTMDSFASVTKIFEKLCCRATGFYEWSRNIDRNIDVYRKYKDYLIVVEPQVDIATLFPATTHRLQADSDFPKTFLQGCADIRKITDYDIVDDRLIADGALENYRLLIIFEGNVIEQSTLEVITNWVKQGGVLLTYNLGPVTTVEGNHSFYNTLLGITDFSKPIVSEAKRIVVNNDMFLKHVSKIPNLTINSCYKGLDESVIQLASKDKDHAAIWANKIGSGCVIAFAGTWDYRTVYYELIRDAVYNLSALDPAFSNAPQINNDWDNVFSVVCSEGVFFLNLENHVVKKIAFDQTIELEPYCIGLITTSQS